MQKVTLVRNEVHVRYDSGVSASPVRRCPSATHDAATYGVSEVRPLPADAPATARAVVLGASCGLEQRGWPRRAALGSGGRI